VHETTFKFLLFEERGLRDIEMAYQGIQKLRMKMQNLKQMLKIKIKITASNMGKCTLFYFTRRAC
jgi:hypothetical protein